jgi:hypothetical protein
MKHVYYLKLERGIFSRGAGALQGEYLRVNPSG